MLINVMRTRALTLSAVVGLALFAGCTAARADQVFNYEFTGANYTGFSGDSASLSGTFSWDATTGSVVASDINLSGFDGTGSDFGAVSCSDCSTGIYDGAGEHFAVNLGPQALYITFADSLSAGANDPLSLAAAEGNQPEYQGGAPFFSNAGGADIATPEPASFTFFATGLLGLGFVVWRRRKCEQ